MPAGTIALTINSKTITGSGTAFTTELKVNDFVVAVVGGVTYTLGVASIASNTSLTLNTAFGGPTTSGLAWTAVPNQAMVGITAQIAADTARAIRGLNYDKANWQQVFSAPGDVTVTLPDGSQFTGPSWKKLVDSTITLDAVDTHLAPWGFGNTTSLPAVGNLNAAAGATDRSIHFIFGGAATNNPVPGTGGRGLMIVESAAYATQIVWMNASGESHVRYKNGTTWSNWGNPTAALSAALLALSTTVSTGLARMGYSLISTTTNLAVNTRTVLTNPFGANTPVIVLVEFYHTVLAKWVSGEFIYNSAAPGSYGIHCSYSEGEGIVLRSGNTALMAATVVSGATQEFTNHYTTAAAVRAHVWKVQS